ncbi:YhgE/Pip family protein [Anaerocolumna sp. MB42-C2]|uniref:YhgE/Pip family protein n=1 Tax=Anaerocolumna sp. MB42-C2 TaxID=3070997 RepID=UPI0027E042CE|nr:YhgE/Pip family protein [Anaerocolumna sp. MB42-C2]WMJ89956.1 YhgE/Pip family protein [Anaerocolumna sp. MB42-C2]
MKKSKKVHIHLNKNFNAFRQVFRIFHSDLGKIMTSWVTVVILIGLTILPAVYAWLNIYASWDPYGNTGGLKVAVINEDAGGTLLGMDYNIGTEIMSTLKTNDKLGWIFCDNKDDALKMVEDGKVYAAIIIPEDFSLSLSTILDEHPKKLSIDYYKNQKLNAIAPKIIDSATNTLKTEISTNIIQTAVSKVLEQINTIGTDIKDNYPDLENSVNLLKHIDENVKELPDRLNNLTNNMEDGVVKIDSASDDFVSIQDTITDLVEFNDNMSEMITDTNKDIDKYSPELRSDLTSVQSLFKDISEDAEYLSSEVKTNKPKFISDINELSSNLTSLKEDLNDISEDLLRINENGVTDVMGLNNDISNDIDNIQKVLNDLKDGSDDLDQAEYLIRKLGNLCDDLADSLGDLEDQLDDLYNTNDDVLASLENISKELTAFVDSINNADNVKNINGTINTLITSLKTIDGILGNNQKLFAGIIATNNKIIDDLNTILKGLVTKDSITSLSNDIKQLSSALNKMTENPVSGIDSQTAAALKNLEGTLTQLENLLSQLENSKAGENIISIILSLESSLKNINSVLENSSGMFGAIITTNNAIIKDLQVLSKSLNANGLNDLENDMKKLNGQISAMRKTLKNSSEDVQDELKDAKRLLRQVDDLSDDLADGLSDLNSDISKYSESISITLKDVQDILSKTNSELAQYHGDGRDKINSFTQDMNEQIDTVNLRLSDLKDKVKNSSRMVTLLDDIKEVSFNASTAVGTVLNGINDEALENLQANLSSGSVLFQDINGILANTKDAINDLSDFSDDVAKRGETTIDKLEKVKKDIPEIQSGFNLITDKIDKLNGDITYDDLVNLVHRDVEEDSDYFSSPVELSSHDVYVSENYGKGLSPFYSVLALWVGGMFLAALLQTKVNQSEVMYTPKQVYFGKFLLFGTVAIAQGFVTALGDLIILRVPIHSPVLFTLLCCFFSLIFSMIIYSLVTTLNNVGKALGIILLLLQVTASGGTFPIQVTPVFFRTIYKFMPFTYAINGLREAIYGVNYDNLTKDIVRLCIFGIIFTLYGILFKKRLNEIFEAFTLNLKKSGIIH